MKYNKIHTSKNMEQGIVQPSFDLWFSVEDCKGLYIKNKGACFKE